MNSLMTSQKRRALSETSDSDDESSSSLPKKQRDNDSSDAETASTYSSVAQKMMAQMGYKKGKGLGKHETGRVNIVEASKQRGRRGLGLRLNGLEATADATWDEDDNVMIRQEPDWISRQPSRIPSLDEMNSWTANNERKETIDDEFEFCEKSILKEILKSKTIFDSLGNKEFLTARTRANPYETIRGGIFQNRAAMKMAEIDASFGFMFSKHADRNPSDPMDMLYFADICAGPGGFSEYVLWRGKWHAKGFGFTLKAEWANDFKVDDFIAGTPETFDCHYGENGYYGDGDIFKEKNLSEFRKYVKENSDGKGVHFVMADGGFSVEGRENIQEILSKQLYLCQFTCALSILRPGGHFLCKLFDIFTPFSVGLIYLLYRAFDQVCIFKPVTSRPANSERYVVCKSLREDASPIHDYLFDINARINRLKGSNIDIREVVPVSLMKEDQSFYEYVFTSNNTIGEQQIRGLKKLATYVQNTMLVGPDQGEVRKQCLTAWDVPSAARSNTPKNDPNNQFDKLTNYAPTDWMIKETVCLDKLSINKIKSIHSYKCTFSGGERCYLFSLGRQVIFKWNPVEHKHPHWKRVDNMNLELPRFTLLDIEFVYELKGDGRGQRKVLAVHILDVIYLGDEYVARKPFSERMKFAEAFAKALSKPCRTDITTVRVKSFVPLQEMGKELEKLEIRQMKKGLARKLCFPLDHEKYFAPIGLYLIRRLKEPWNLQYSRSNNRLYFYNHSTGESKYEGSEESVATASYCIESRLSWEWGEDASFELTSSKKDSLSKDEFLAFINDKK